MTEFCDLCRSSRLEQVYQPAGSGRRVNVHLCARCGLVQALQRTGPVAAASDADLENTCFDKGLRADSCFSMIRAHVNLRSPLNVLDAGSHRGAFARALLAAAPEAQLVCVEPDEQMAECCAGLERTTLIRARIEDVALPEASFDIIHSCHTIGHLGSPASALADYWRLLKPGGLLIVDTPNVGAISGDDVIEEWFSDNHLYHFSKVTLARLLDASGFEIVGEPDPNDPDNLLFAARKWSVAARPVRRDLREVDAALALIASYAINRGHNLSASAHVASTIAELAPERVVLWGAGPLFDALVEQGGFDPKLLTALIDTRLHGRVAERHGCAISGAEALGATKPGVIVVMARSVSSEIARLAAKDAPNAEIILYSDLLSRARTRLAA